MPASLWNASLNELNFPPLSGAVAADVAVIGGGITGITSAMLLAREGKKVVVLEAYGTGQGTTGSSTGNLYGTVDSLLSRVQSSWNRRTIETVVRSREDTLRFIEEIIARYKIACSFSRRPLYLFSMNKSQDRELEQEYQAMSEAGLNARSVDVVPLPFPVSRAIMLEDQAQFNPLLYVRLLAKSIESDACRIFENSKVTEIDHERLTVSTASGTVRAGKIVVATHTPKGFNILQTELGPYREYGIAARLTDSSYPDGIFWSMDPPGYSLRSFELYGKQYLITIGEKHKTGQHEAGVDYFKRVEEYTASRFNVASVDYRWSAQHYRPADTLPYIGRTAASGSIYVATGFGTDGLIYGSLAARIIADDILGRENQWAGLYRSTRFTPAKSAKELIAENVNVAQQYVKDYLIRRDASALSYINPGQGDVVRIGKESTAIYRTVEGGEIRLSPVCTHFWMHGALERHGAKLGLSLPWKPFSCGRRSHRRTCNQAAAEPG